MIADWLTRRTASHILPVFGCLVVARFSFLFYWDTGNDGVKSYANADQKRIKGRQTESQDSTNTHTRAKYKNNSASILDRSAMNKCVCVCVLVSWNLNSQSKPLWHRVFAHTPSQMGLDQETNITAQRTITMKLRRKSKNDAFGNSSEPRFPDEEIKN